MLNPITAQSTPRWTSRQVAESVPLIRRLARLRNDPPFAVFICFLVLSMTPNKSVNGDEQKPAVSVDCKELIDIHLPANPEHADFVMQIQYSDRLVCLVRNEAVYRALLSRVGLDVKYRKEGFAGLVALHQTQPIEEWLALIKRLDSKGVVLDPREGARSAKKKEVRSVLDSYVLLLSEMDKQDLSTAKQKFIALIKNARESQIRQLGYAGLLHAGMELDGVWELASTQEEGIIDLLEAGRWIPAQQRIAVWNKANNATLIDSDTKVALIQFAQVVPGKDLEIFNFLKNQIVGDADDTGVNRFIISTLAARDSSKWPLAGSRKLTGDLMRWYRNLDTKDRNSTSAKQLRFVIDRLAEKLPQSERDVLLFRLKGLEVAQYTITALREQMAFDQDVLVLRAGQPVEITFKNNDNMPHNLVLVRPGSMEKVGVAADRLAIQSSNTPKQYVPKLSEVLHHTGMIESGRTGKVVFEVPAEEGVYPLLCTFPGHWLKMFSAVVVTNDREAYLAANQPLPTRDSLLGIKNYNHRFEDLAEKVSNLKGSRSFSRGESAFYSRACVSCHAVGGKGGNVGPELSTVASKQTAEDILRSIMYPSEKIDPAYAKVEVEHIETGKIYGGVLIPQDNKEIVYLIEDPLAECEPQVFKRNEVEIVPLKISPMPKDLLKRSSPEEVLDLVAYLLSGGNPEHPFFSSN